MAHSHSKAYPHESIQVTTEVVRVRGMSPENFMSGYSARMYRCTDCGYSGTRRFLKLIPCGSRGRRLWKIEELPPTVKPPQAA